MDSTAQRLQKAIRTEAARRTDPAMLVSGAPNFGQEAVPHVTSFVGLVGTLSKVYRGADEALHHSLDNARFMRNDVGIMESLEQRMRLTSQLAWHIEPEDGQSTEQKELASEVTKLLGRVRRFSEMRRVLMEAIWYGKYAVQFRWDRHRVGNREYFIPTPSPKRESYGWTPINGDKMVFRWDDDTDPIYAHNGEELGPIGIRVNLARVSEKMRPYCFPTDRGNAYFPPLWQRGMFCIHKHQIEDAAYEDPLNAASIHGVGIRSRIYWEWFQKQEMLAFLMEMLERSAGGIEIWEYPAGNKDAENKCKAAALNRGGPNKNVILFPKPQDETASLFDVRHVFWDTSGAQVIKELLETYFGHRIKRYILGQTLSSEADATGLGSGVADIHLDTLMQIVRYDATNLAETLTYEYLKRVIEYNFPHAGGHHLKFVLETDTPNAQETIKGFETAWQMGARIKESDVLDLIGAAIPTTTDRILPSPNQGGGIGAGMPGDGMPGEESGSAPATDPNVVSDHIVNGLAEAFNGGDDGASLMGAQADDTPPGGQPDRYAARTAKDAAKQTERNPTDAQKAAGNYRKGVFSWNGWEVAIENPKGSTRSGCDANGKKWSVKLPVSYGYLKRPKGADGDQFDVFIGPDLASDFVAVVDQRTKDGKFDEHKLLIGFTNADEALNAYVDSYSKGWNRLENITPMTVQQFCAWMKSGKPRQAIASQVSRYSMEAAS
ncbi:MAG: DUF935 family protein [Candidatus Nanopelagicales bacterium]